jgi:hypothetical protein
MRRVFRDRRPHRHRAGRFPQHRPEKRDLRIYDVQGRKVRRVLSAASAAPGTYSIPWDGRDEGGRPVPPGMYFMRWSTDRERQSVLTGQE